MQRMFKLERPLCGYLKTMDTQSGYPIGVVIWCSNNHLYKCFPVCLLEKKCKLKAKIYQNCIVLRVSNSTMSWKIDEKSSKIKLWSQTSNSEDVYQVEVLHYSEKILTIHNFFSIITTNIFQLAYINCTVNE